MADIGLSASPPRKIAKMDQLSGGSPASKDTLVPKSAMSSESPIPPPPVKKRLGLSTGLEKAGSKKLVLKPKGSL
jgi:hypothetical protein